MSDEGIDVPVVSADLVGEQLKFKFKGRFKFNSYL